MALKIFRKPAMALMIIQKASYMTLKMIQKVAYDPEDDSESRL
jgi:hypothetical protein